MSTFTYASALNIYVFIEDTDEDWEEEEIDLLAKKDSLHLN